MRRRQAWRRGRRGNKRKALLRRLRQKISRKDRQLSDLNTTCRWLADALYNAQLEIERLEALEHELAM